MMLSTDDNNDDDVPKAEVKVFVAMEAAAAIAFIVVNSFGLLLFYQYYLCVREIVCCFGFGFLL